MRRAKIGRKLSLDYMGQEAVNTICSNIEFAGRNLRRIVITSCEANEGKTFVAIHVAACMAGRGKRVLLMDADLRLSALRLQYKVRLSDDGAGLAHLLSGQCGIEDVIYQTNIDNLWLLPDGTDVQAPLSLLATKEFGQMMDALAERFDVIIVDAPPVGAVIDAAEIARRCDGTVFVLENGRTGRRELREAVAQMTRSGTPVLGCVLNKVSAGRLGSGRYYYRYGYGRGYYARRPGARKGE